jgi:uncharacterized protein YqgC (DUF456 family)
MTTLIGTLGVRKIGLPTRREMRTMLQNPWVAVTAIVAGLVVVLAFVSAMVFLAYSGRSTEALTAAVVGPIVGALVNMHNKLSRIEKVVDANNKSA